MDQPFTDPDKRQKRPSAATKSARQSTRAENTPVSDKDSNEASPQTNDAHCLDLSPGLAIRAMALI